MDFVLFVKIKSKNEHTVVRKSKKRQGSLSLFAKKELQRQQVRFCVACHEKVAKRAVGAKNRGLPLKMYKNTRAK